MEDFTIRCFHSGLSSEKMDKNVCRPNNDLLVVQMDKKWVLLRNS